MKTNEDIIKELKKEKPDRIWEFDEPALTNALNKVRVDTAKQLVKFSTEKKLKEIEKQIIQLNKEYLYINETLKKINETLDYDLDMILLFLLPKPFKKEFMKELKNKYKSPSISKDELLYISDSFRDLNNNKYYHSKNFKKFMKNLKK
jgi:hypothetical protein